MDEKEHSIRFINSSYDTLFRIPDGGTVEVQFPDRKFTARCKYLDDYHTVVGNSVFHICEFAEHLEHRTDRFVLNRKSQQNKPPGSSDTESIWPSSGRIPALITPSTVKGLSLKMEVSWMLRNSP